jgi:glutathione S-transferase
MTRIFHREHAGRPVRVAWTLAEIGEPFEVSIMDREEAKGQEHRSRHPLGRVPVLETGDGTIFESAAICMHLADLSPEAGLMPPVGSHDRALVYQWATFVPAELEPPLIESAIYAQSDPERSAKARRRFDLAAAAVSDALGDREYLVGDRFSVADVMMGTALGFTDRMGIPEALAPNLRAYVDRLKERPAFRRAAELAPA